MKLTPISQWRASKFMHKSPERARTRNSLKTTVTFEGHSLSVESIAMENNLYSIYFNILSPSIRVSPPPYQYDLPLSKVILLQLSPPSGVHVRHFVCPPFLFVPSVGIIQPGRYCRTSIFFHITVVN